MSIRSTIRKWQALSPREKRLFLSACILLSTARPVLALVPLRWIRKATTGPGREPSPHEIRKIRQAIDRAANRVPASTCLTRALAASVLLRSARLPRHLVIGVRKSAAGEFAAHAWVLSGAEIVTGDLPDLTTYHPLPPAARFPPL